LYKIIFLNSSYYSGANQINWAKVSSPKLTNLTMSSLLQLQHIARIRILYVLLAFTAVLLSQTVASGQVTEICNNGIDDDFDGFIDCYDGSCANSSFCDGIFLGNDAKCSVPPPQFPKFTMTIDFATPNETTNHLARMAIGDLDRDGMPELVSMNRYTKKLFILNGNDGSIKSQTTVTWEPQWEVAIANLNNDTCGEIFFIGYQDLPGSSNDGIYLFAYDCQLNLLWQTAKRLPSDPINFGLADFDGDGLVELYAKDEIYDAHSGVRIVKSTAPSYTRINGGPVAVDMIDDSNLELVLGLGIYKVNLGSRTLDAGSLTLLKSRGEYFIRNEFNATSVADFNQDGNLDVIASGSETAFNKTTTIFYWDVKNDVLKTYRDLTGSYAPNGWANGTGRVNIADLDGDGKLNASYVSGKYLYALKEDLTLLWRIVINEETSGYTGCTLFDFNGDGKSEIVYRDEQFLYIIDGTDGSVYNQKACISRTNREYPIVADVDADGSTELCVTCGFDDALSKTNFGNLGFSRYSHIRVFKSAAEPWVPARRVWNQHGYFVVNVNDDLTIPKVLQKHQLVFSTGNCTQGPNRPLNKFLNQSPFLNSEGCPTYASPDIAFANTPSVIPPTCPDLNFNVSFQITNLGDVGLSGNIPITFYTKNPALAGSTKLNTINVSLADLKPNDVVDVINATVTGIGADSLYIVLNDAGTTVPTPISLPNTTFFECDYDNIIGIKVIPKPVFITALAVSPNEKCAPPDNGSARAFIPISAGNENTSDYDFYWSDGLVAKPTTSADFTGPIYTGLAEGTYTVYAIHKTANCSSDTAQVTINSIQSIVPDVVISVLSHQTQCNPPNGKLEALVAGGNAGYTFEWFDNANSLGITTSIANGLIGGNYTVFVSRNGCTKSANAIVNDNAPDPDVIATSTPIVNCQNPNSGTVTASASIGGTPQNAADFTFTWYFYDQATSTRGSQLPAANGSGPTRTGLSAGHYQVVATNNGSQCPSLPIVVEVNTETVLPVVAITQLKPQTSCDPTNPNGSLQAIVTIAGVNQNPADFTFEWFVGQNTLPANLYTTVSGVNGSIADKVVGGGQSYTVKATSASQCSSIDDDVVNEFVVNPVVTLTATPDALCDPLLVTIGSPVRGSVTASVSFAGNPVSDLSNYKFDWYNGTQAVGPKRTETSSVLSSLSGGFYTVVATRTDLFCPAIPKTIEVINTAELPRITTNIISSTNCDPLLANGQAFVTDVDGVGTSSPYAFQWHTGVDTSVPLPSAKAATLGNLQGGAGAYFTVLVTNQANGCQNTATVEVPNNQSLPVVTLTSTDNENCSAPFNGIASVNTITYKGLPEGLGGYTFSWLHGESNSTAAGLKAGTYELKVTRIDVGCVSDPVQVDVVDNLYIPIINIDISNQTSCDGLNPNGLLSASLNETSIGGSSTATLGYTYMWTKNGSPFNPVGPTMGTTSSINSQPGNLYYTVSVERTATRCINSKSVFLPERIKLPRLELVATDIIDCNTHGFVTAKIFIDKNNDGDSNDASDELTVAEYADYSITWFQGSSTSGILLSGTSRVLNELGAGIPLPAGNYTAVATSNVTKCKTADITDVVNGPGPLFNIDLEINNRPASCADSDGVITAFVNVGGGVPAPFGDFVFQWFQGNPTNGLASPTPSFYTSPSVQFIQPPLVVDPNSISGVPFPGSPSPQAPTGVNTGPTLFGRTSGTYSVVVQRKSDGCKEFKTVFLPFLQEPVIILARIKPDECSGDVGEVEVELTAPFPANQYFLQIYPTSNPVLGTDIPLDVINPAAGTNNLFSSLASGVYTIVARENPGIIPTACYSSPVLVQLIEALPPKVDILGSTANSTCVGAPLIGDGSLEIKISTDPNDPFSASYPIPPPPTILQKGSAPFTTYSIAVKDAGNTNLPGYPTASTFVDGDTEIINGLRGEPYTITVTSSKGCTLTKIFTVPNAPQVATLGGDVTILPALACDPVLETNAQIEINELAILGSAVSDNLSDYQFDWFTNASLTTTILTANGDNSAAIKGGEVLSNVGAPLPIAPVTAGSYWVRATKVVAGATGGLGCLSAPLKVDIDDESIKPSGAITATANTACDTNYEGSVAVNITDPGSMPTPDYNYSWTFPIASPIANAISNGDGIGTDDVFNGLSEGTYSLSFRNNRSGCVGFVETTILKSATSIVITRATATDQLICNPDGSVTVGANDILVGGLVDSNHAHFDFTWSRSNVSSIVIGPSQGVDQINTTNLPTIGADSYFVKVKKRSGLNPGSGCESAPSKVEINDKSKNPDITFTSIIPNSSCALLNPNGFLRATATERAGPPGSYSFMWTLDGGTLPLITVQGGTSPVSELTNAGQGIYLVEATNTLTGCKFSQASELVTNQSLSLPNIVDISQTNPINCLPQGSVQVVSLTIGGTSTFTNPPDDLNTAYDYQWYKSSFPSGLLVGEQNSVLSNQLPGRYFVTVKNLTTQCVSAAVEAVIDSANIVYPVVSIQQIAPQILCSVNLGSGALSATADGKNDADPNYDFNWFSNLTASGTALASTSSITGLLSGDYSLEVRDISTDCRARAIFILPENRLEFTPVLALSSNPLTQCDANDGSVFARGVLFPVNSDPSKNYPFAYDYRADLYVGNPPTNLNNPEFPDMPQDPNNPLLTENHIQENLVNGIYTVRLTDNNTGCFTIDKIAIEDLRKYPKPIITNRSPVTNCDPANPNGVASVLVDGTFIGFEFNWYESSTVSGSSVYTGAEFGRLKVAPQTYTIEAKNLVTGCSGTVQTTIASETLPIPSPQIEIRSHITSCLFNNGALAASVGGVTKDYVFNWYDGAVESPPADFVGELYDSLASGKYSVTATSRITGCKSPLVSEELLVKKGFPAFDFEIQKASCNLPDGFANVFFSSTIGIALIEWISSNQVIAVGPNLTDAFPGTYTVSITSELGCNTTRDMILQADIRPRNGISRNGDSQNDYFHIDCIDEFENNNVKIYNRAGTLVYEADRYDNTTTYFDGVSNRGLSLIGSNVPDGTYFYIVDKRDGSKPIAGYLEIVK